MSKIIGRIHWDGCEGCIHNQDGCSIDEQELMDNASIDFMNETVECGCYHIKPTSEDLEK